MINTLFLDASEKRTVMGGSYNFVAKSLFPCSIRVLNKFGIEEDRFDNITSGFGFKLPSTDLYKLEVTNNIYDQDIKIYSGKFEIKNLSPFSEEFKIRVYLGTQAAVYSYARIYSENKQAFKITLDSINTHTFKVLVYANETAVGTILSTTLLLNMNNDDNTKQVYYENGTMSSVLSSNVLSYTKLYGDSYHTPIDSFIVPANHGLFLVNIATDKNLFPNVKVVV